VSDYLTEAEAHAVEDPEEREKLTAVVAGSGPTRRRRIGEVREQVEDVAPGYYPPLDGDKKDVIEVLVKTPLVRVEVLSYKHPATRVDLGWHLKGWRELNEDELKVQRAKERLEAETHLAMARVRQIEKLRVQPSRTWWQRLWYRFCHPFKRRHRVAPARVVNTEEASWTKS
jgi:hypothetical protein